MLELGDIQVPGGKKDQGAVALIMDLAKAFEWVGLLVVRAMWLLRAPEAGSVRRMCGGAACPRIVLQGALSEVTQILPLSPAEVNGFCG